MHLISILIRPLFTLLLVRWLSGKNRQSKRYVYRSNFCWTFNKQAAISGIKIHWNLVRSFFFFAKAFTNHTVLEQKNFLAKITSHEVIMAWCTKTGSAKEGETFSTITWLNYILIRNSCIVDKWVWCFEETIGFYFYLTSVRMQ